MRIRRLHAWNLNPQSAIQAQEKLAPQVVQRGVPTQVRYIAGADVSTQKASSRAFAGVVLMRYPSMEVVERMGSAFKISFPYIPGLLAFREAPPLLQLFRRLRRNPDLILFDGQGIAHPRRLGIASHMGLLLDTPSIGCAKTRLIGRFDVPAVGRGSFSYLYHEKDGSVIGGVLRTRTGVRPVFSSVGHRINLYSAMEWILATCRGFRLPEPIREAHRFVNRLRLQG